MSTLLNRALTFEIVPGGGLDDARRVSSQFIQRVKLIAAASS